MDSPLKETIPAYARDLSNESGVIVMPPGEYYPKIDDPSTDIFNDLYEEFIRQVDAELVILGWARSSREPYYGGPIPSGGMVTAGDLIQVVERIPDVAWHALDIYTFLFPEHGPKLISLLRSALGVITVKLAVLRVLDRNGLSPRSAQNVVGLQEQVVGLCLVDALSDRRTDEWDFSLDAVVPIAISYASPAHPSGLEEYVVSISSNQRAFTYWINGRGQGSVRIFDRNNRTNHVTGVSLMDRTLGHGVEA